MIYVLGIGNVLMGDDGFGPTVVRALDARYSSNAEVEFIDIGTPGLDLTPWLFDAERVVIIDTVKADATPGTLRVYDKADILRHAPSVRVGPHDPGVKEALFALDFAGHGPEQVTLVGVVPASVAMSTELSQPVRDAIPAAIDEVIAALGRFGAAPVPGSSPEASLVQPWWNRS